MIKLKPSRRTALAALIASAGLFGIATAVQASIPEAGGIIHGCYNTSRSHEAATGALRVIDMAKPDGKCASWESSLNWNVKGPTGPQGPQGVQGPRGDTGPAGLAGTNGISGYEVVFALNKPHVSEAFAQCPTGKKVIGGGGGGASINLSAPSNDNTAWSVSADPAYVISAYAICATVTP
jgi:hypothetical protein